MTFWRMSKNQPMMKGPAVTPGAALENSCPQAQCIGECCAASMLKASDVNGSIRRGSWRSKQTASQDALQTMKSLVARNQAAILSLNQVIGLYQIRWKSEETQKTSHNPNRQVSPAKWNVDQLATTALDLLIFRLLQQNSSPPKCMSVTVPLGIHYTLDFTPLGFQFCCA